MQSSRGQATICPQPDPQGSFDVQQVKVSANCCGVSISERIRRIPDKTHLREYIAMFMPKKTLWKFEVEQGNMLKDSKIN